MVAMAFDTSVMLTTAPRCNVEQVEQVGQTARGIREYGWTNPVLIDEHDQIIAGHGRVAAARRLGIHVVPCLRLDFMDAAQKRAYVVADKAGAKGKDDDEGEAEYMLKVWSNDEAEILAVKKLGGINKAAGKVDAHRVIGMLQRY